MSGRILKGDGATPKTASAGRVLKQEVYSAGEDAKRIRDDAQADAERRVASAHLEAERIREAAREQGYEDGIAKLNELALRFQEQQSKLQEENRASLIRLAVRVSEKILGRELEVNEDALTDIVIRAIRGIRHERRIQIRVHPSELAKSRAGLGRILEEVGATKEIEFREDASVTSGGCIVETDLGIIDARLDTQLRVLEKALLARRG